MPFISPKNAGVIEAPTARVETSTAEDVPINAGGVDNCEIATM